MEIPPLPTLAESREWEEYLSVSEDISEEDDNLTPEDITAIREGIRRGLAAVAAGRVRPANEVFAEMKSRYGIAEL